MIKSNNYKLIKQKMLYKNNIVFNAFYFDELIGIILIKANKNNCLLKVKIVKKSFNNDKNYLYILKLIINYLFKNHIDRIYMVNNSDNVKYLNFKEISHCNNKMYKGNCKSKTSYVLTKQDFYFINKYDTILFDIDDTILSFHKAEKIALTKALKAVNIDATDEIIKHYHKINISYWEKVEKKLITREQCVVDRFKEFLPLYNISCDPFKFEDLYRYYLNKQAYIIKDARKVLSKLSKTHRIYAITNGVKETQNKRMKKADMNKFFIKSFISEEIGFDKPSINFLNAVIKGIDNFNKEKTIIIGDSLTSDIALGVNNNIDTCWFNLHNIKNKKSIEPKYTIYFLNELIF